ncbi:hypothetical protein [Bifidobacterium vansinderenii]|uniref:Uncharacterized protein n=1 Tax=Bifidobacterium vansinderenii TaxID=1984871 RepID=A0A229VW91_9BIFI|nr:hypothetical protein [Bifidobacterium vansinderenii]OXM99897.1 hypothetical protein Tam10B_1860 [Bifidobacterium vansinderenii]
MGIYTTEPHHVLTTDDIIHDYARAFASDPDDIDERTRQFLQWLKRHDRAAMAQAWTLGTIYGMNAVKAAADSVRIDPINENPYIGKENQ